MKTTLQTVKKMIVIYIICSKAKEARHGDNELSSLPCKNCILCKKITFHHKFRIKFYSKSLLVWYKTSLLQMMRTEIAGCTLFICSQLDHRLSAFIERCWQRTLPAICG